jgi:hypothetical protein
MTRPHVDARAVQFAAAAAHHQRAAATVVA